MEMNHLSLSRPVTLVLLLLLASCRSAAPPLIDSGSWEQRQLLLSSLENWQLQGRVNARYYDESHTPRIRWQQAADTYTIRLWGALNAGATRIDGVPGHVRLEQGGEIREAERPEDLILEHLGYELPVSELNYWIRGLPDPSSAHELNLGDLNEVLSLHQAGWSINFEDYRMFGVYSLPRRIEMQRDEEAISLLFIGLNWTFGESASQ